MNDSGTHLDLDTLADLDEGLLDDEAVRVARQHLESCTECQASARSLTSVRAALRDLPPATMPAEVADRIDAAVSAEQPPASSATVVPLAPRRRRGAGLAGAAAAAAVVLLVAGIVAGALRSSHHTPTATTAGSARAPSGSQQFVETASGRNYTSTNLASGAALLIGHSERAASALDQSTGSTAGRGSAPPNAALTPARPSLASAHPLPTEFGRLRGNTLALFDCISALTGSPGQTVPLAVDYADFNGKPAVVIVLPTPNNPTRADVWVVGPGCSAKDDQTRYFVRIPR